MKGIDVSAYQGKIDFTKVKNSGIEVVILKATEGKTYKDPQFKTYYNDAKSADLKVGVYHFLRANETEDEINNLLSVIDGLSLDCKIVIDGEVDLGGIDLTSAKVRQFADALKLKGFDIALYTGSYFYNNNLNDTVKDLPLWVAQYSGKKPDVNTDYIGWQYSSSGEVGGIVGDVDMDEFSDKIFNEKEKEVSKVEETKKLQHNLNRLLNFNIAEDGIIGPITQNAIKVFQTAAGLKVDGIAGPITENAINTILAKPVSSINKISSTLVNKFIQYRTGTKNDGIWKSETHNAVKNWQRKNGLKVDGIIGPDSWNKLIK